MITPRRRAAAGLAMAGFSLVFAGCAAEPAGRPAPPAAAAPPAASAVPAPTPAPEGAPADAPAAPTADADEVTVYSLVTSGGG